MKIKNSFAICLLALGCLAFSQAEKISLSDLVMQADIIVQAKVENTEANWVEDERGRHIYTVATLHVDTMLKGQLSQEQFTIEVVGGTVGEVTEFVTESFSLLKDEEVILFLKANPLQIAGGFQGKVTVYNGKVYLENKEVAADRFVQAIQLLTKNPGSVVPFLEDSMELKLHVTTDPIPGVSLERGKTGKDSSATPRSSLATSSTSGLVQPNLIANYTPSGWDYPIVPSNTTGTNKLENLVEGTTYVDFAFVNRDQDISTSTQFYIYLYYDGSYVQGWYWNGLSQNSYGYVEDYQLPFSVATGTHIMQTNVDATNAIAESNELDNEYQKSFFWQTATTPVIADITPDKASAGTNTTVTITGTHFGTTQGISQVEFFYRAGQPKIEAPIVSWSNTQIVCEVPTAIINNYPASASSGPVTVTTNSGTSNGFKFKVSFGYGGIKWQGTTPVVQYRINKNYSSATGEGARVQAGASTWNGAGTSFSLQYEGSTSASVASQNSVNEILWGSMPSSATTALAITYYWFTNFSLTECDMVFNKLINWSAAETPEPLQYDIQSIALHELGHFLNLRDIYGDISDGEHDIAKVMYGIGSFGAVKRSLHPDDIVGIRWIYGTSAPYPDITVDPSSWNYGSITIGSYSDETIVIKNDGTTDLHVAATTLIGANASEFSIQSGSGTFTLAPAATKNVVVRFSPTSAGSKSANLSISSNDPDENPLLVGFSGTGRETPGAPIYPDAPSTQMAGTEFWVDLKIGTNANPVSNLFGLSFELNFSPTDYLDVATPHSINVLAGSFLGSDVIFFMYVDETEGKVSIGISRKAGQGGIDGNGTVAQVKFVSKISTPHNTSVQFTLSNITANDPVGNAIALSPASLAVTIHAGLVIWPGDTDNNQIVNQADVLPIGLYWARTGAARTCHNNELQWIDHIAMPWNPVAATYADANGDGTVNQADVLPIGLNWNRIHSVLLVENPAFPSLEKTQTDTAIIMISWKNRNANPREDFSFDIITKNVTDLFGLAYELSYTPKSFIDTIYAVAATDSNLLGNDIIFFPIIEKTKSDTQKVSVGITRKFGQGGVTAKNGLLTRINVHMSANAMIDKSAIRFRFDRILANDPAGNQVPFKIDMTSLKLATLIAAQANNELPTNCTLLQNYPNPFNSSTLIRYYVARQAKIRLEVFNLLGENISVLVDEEQNSGWHGTSFEAKELPSGIYFYQLTAPSFLKVGKMIFVR